MKTLIKYVPLVFSTFERRNQRQLRKLNDRVMKETAIEFNKVNFNLAVYSYVLGKIVSKPRWFLPEHVKALEGIEKVLRKLDRNAASENEKEILSIFKELERAIKALEKEDSRFVTGLVTKGKLKMAATFYAQGLSLGMASEMTGLDKQEILDYAGQTMMFDRVKEEKNISERMKLARSMLFG